MRRANALIGSALALTIALAGCADATREASNDAPDAPVVGQTAAAGGEVPNNTGDPLAQTSIPSDTAAGEAAPTSAILPTAVEVPAPDSSPVASEAGGPGGAASSGSGFGTVPFTRTASITIGADGSLSAEPIQVAAGEVFSLTLANNGSSDVLMRVPLGEAGELGVMLRAAAMAATDGGSTGAASGATTPNSGTAGDATSSATSGSTSATGEATSGSSTATTATTGDNAANSTTGAGTGGNTAESTSGAANASGNANSQGGSTGGPSGGPDTATGGSNDNIITDSAAAVPTIEAGGSANTEGSAQGSAAQGSGSSAAQGTVGSVAQTSMQAPVTLLMRFTEPGTYTITCVPMGAMDAATGTGGAAAGPVEQSSENNAGTPTTGTPTAANAENSGTTPDAMNGGCSGELTIVVGEAAAASDNTTDGAATSGAATSGTGSDGVTGDSGTGASPGNGSNTSSSPGNASGTDSQSGSATTTP